MIDNGLRNLSPGSVACLPWLCRRPTRRHNRPLTRAPMLRSADRYVPAAFVERTCLDHRTVLTATQTGEQLALTPTGERVWTMLHAERRTVDRLVVALARQSSGQALVEVPDLVRGELDSFVSRGFVERVPAVV